MGGVRGGGVVGVMGGSTSNKSIITDINWNHELLHDHDMHGAKVLCYSANTVRNFISAPVLF